MSRFLGLLQVEELDECARKSLRLSSDTDWFRLTSTLRYWSDRAKTCIEVPSGFVTDYASVPRIFWVMLPPEDIHYTRAAVIHDWIYNQHAYPQSECDLILLEAMQSLQAPGWKCQAIYQAVRLFGATAYNSETRQTCRLAA